MEGFAASAYLFCYLTIHIENTKTLFIYTAKYNKGTIESKCIESIKLVGCGQISIRGVVNQC